VNNDYRQALKDAGMICVWPVSGWPHPLFRGFVEVALKNKEV
jgi:hypothetical protein